jgi:hypothetical protein
VYYLSFRQRLATREGFERLSRGQQGAPRAETTPARGHKLDAAAPQVTVECWVDHDVEVLS